MNNRLVFIVEGNTEVEFITKKIIPYLEQKRGNTYTTFMNAQKITTNKKMNCKGGVVNFEYLKNEIKRVASKRNVLITTLIDFFRLPNNFPNYSTDKNKVDSIEEGISKEMEKLIASNHFLPYIQLHEFEALMFIDAEKFEIITESDSQKKQIEDIISKYPNPENINGGCDTAPSKRLISIIPTYEKVFFSSLIFSELSIDDIRKKAPRFNEWLDRIERALDNNQFT
jgi:hypothetical protein